MILSEMRSNLIFWIVAIIIMLPLIIMTHKCAKKEGMEDFKKFDSAEINSRIEFVDVYSQSDHIILSDGREFFFRSYTNKELNNLSIFSYTAIKGDSIAKRAYSDTLYLFKGNQKFAYLFDTDYRGK